MGGFQRPDNDLQLAVRLLIEITGCSSDTAADLVDLIARYAIIKAQSCLPAGW